MSLILLTAGGTGGHVFPAEALASELGRRGHRLALLTDRRGATYGGALAKIDSYPISGGGIAGKTFTQRLISLASLARGYWQARRLIRRLRPMAVVGFGGYASVPAVLAACHVGVPTMIHEQNAVLGRANRLLAPRVRRIATSYAKVGKIKPEWQTKIHQTGMPVRPSIVAAPATAYPSLDDQKPLFLLVVGGSQGAKIFSELVPAAMLLLPAALKQKLMVSQQCRAEDIDRVTQVYRDHDIAADLRNFFDDVPERLAASHLVIARSGASTMAELAAVGRPAVLVPYLYAVDDHQSANARAFADVGGGWLLPQAGLTAEGLAACLTALLTAPERLRRAAACAYDAGIADAAERLADQVVALTEERL